MRLLVIEDEEDLLDALLYGLRKKGFCADGVGDGVEGLSMALSGIYDLIILDLNLPGMDGMEVLESIRSRDKEQRILILSARTSHAQRIEGLDMGANDYLVKPFDFGELVARISGLLRRRFVQEEAVLEFEGIRLDTAQRQAFTRQGEPLHLAAKEYSILEYLLLHRGRAVSAEELIDHVWQDENGLFSNSIKVHMSQLRKKLRPHMADEAITTVRGAGYLIKREDAKA